MLAFKDATDAVCWAMLLNLALLRSASGPQPDPASKNLDSPVLLTACTNPQLAAIYVLLSFLSEASKWRFAVCSCIPFQQIWYCWT